MNPIRLLLSLPLVARRTVRRRELRLVAVAALVLGIAVPIHAVPAQAKPPSQWVEGELLVGLRAGVGAGRAEALYHAHGATVVEEIGQIRVVRLRVPAPAQDAIAQSLARQPEVKFVEKNYVFEPALSPNDPQYPSQWHLPRILAPQAWDLTQGAPGVVIAIVDSGVDPYHPDLAGKLVGGYNTYSNNTNTADTYGHGTEVAGAAGAQSNNGLGIASVAGQSPIMPIRATNNSGRATSATLASGVVWASDHGASVINLSFEGVAGNATIRTAAEYAFNRGALVVAASGNCGCFDATAENPFVLSVSATDQNDNLAYFSSTGSYVDLSAPGTNILTTALGGLYFSDSGTSLASPVVAGVAALMFSSNPALTPAVATELLEATAQDAGAAGYDTGFGFGRVNAYAAVAAAAGYTPPPDITPPTASITAPGAGATVSGTTVVDVSAADDVGVMQVDLYLDGAFFATDASSPYSFAWDTTTASNGSHTLQAVATDAAGNTASAAAITVTVANVNQPPLAANDAFTVPYRSGNSYTPRVLNVLANDRDPDGSLDPATVRIVGAPNKGGTVTVNTNGTLSYTPKKNYRGTETFSYNVRDNLGTTSNTATVTVTVQ